MKDEARREEVIEAFGRVIKDRRLKRDRTQEDVAGELGMDRAYLSLVESGKKQPTISTIFNLCDELGVKVSTVMAEVEKDL